MEMKLFVMVFVFLHLTVSKYFAMRLMIKSSYLILLDDQDKEHVHRACIPNEKQGKLREFEVGCNTNHTDIKFRRPDGTVRYFVLLILKF